VYSQDFGIIGLGVMGENLALNIANHGFSVTGLDTDAKKVEKFRSATSGKNVVGSVSVREFLSSLKIPRRILVMVPAGKPVDAVIAELKGSLSRGDVLIDGGNSFFGDTEHRLNELESTGILFVGAGVSGGEEGALLGPSIMPGGNPAAWPLVKNVLQAIAAKTDDGWACCDWVGSGGSGHFVKMVHNGIEYSDMQMISEAYHLMSRLLGMSAVEMSGVFKEWNAGELNSYLIEITSDILARKDPLTNKPMVEVILDSAEQKGTGKWTSQAALDLGTPAQTIADAVFARMLSAMKNERVAASAILQGPTSSFTEDKRTLLEGIRKALFCSKICSYAQGFQLLRAAETQYKWNLSLGTIAKLWRAGCIIRAQFLGNITEAYARNAALNNLLLDQYFSRIVNSYQQSWRNVIAIAVEQGIPVSGFMSALSYYDSYRSALLPANLLQAQRDYFGAHTYRRNDRDGVFHTIWNEQPK